MSKNYSNVYENIHREIDKAYEEEAVEYAWYCEKHKEWQSSREKPKPKPKKKVVKKPNIKVVDNFIDWPLAA
jgi:hypothetical protein